MNHYRVAAVFLLGFGTGAGVWESWLLGLCLLGLAAMLVMVVDDTPPV